MRHFRKNLFKLKKIINLTSRCSAISSVHWQIPRLTIPRAAPNNSQYYHNYQQNAEQYAQNDCGNPRWTQPDVPYIHRKCAWVPCDIVSSHCDSRLTAASRIGRSDVIFCARNVRCPYQNSLGLRFNAQNSGLPVSCGHLETPKTTGAITGVFFAVAPSAVRVVQIGTMRIGDSARCENTYVGRLRDN